MTEKLLQFIWQFQYFNQSQLVTSEGEPLHILSPGMLNTGQGPDFSEARIRIGDTLFAGSVELHVNTSQWQEHGHDEDDNYRNVILHVVYHHDVADSTLPLLELQPRISNILLEHYESLMHTTSFIPCAASLPTVSYLILESFKERLIAERLMRRSEQITVLLKENKYHWEETLWWLLAKNFGIRTNAETFEAVARSIPLSIIRKHQARILQLEALLMGQAGLLSFHYNDSYPQLLKREYHFLKKKYALKPVHQPVHFLRMRPGNFPTIRLAQLAAVLQQSSQQFTVIVDTKKLKEIRSAFSVAANDYWHYHYRFDELSPYKIKLLGRDMIDNIMINTVVPILFTYGNYHGDEQQKRKAVDWLHEIPGESNSITKGFADLRLKTDTAFDSQAMLELKTQYCDHRNCLRCSIGNKILGTAVLQH